MDFNNMEKKRLRRKRRQLYSIITDAKALELKRELAEKHLAHAIEGLLFQRLITKSYCS